MTTKLYHAACQCGAIRYLARVDITMSMRCICGHCRNRGINALRIAHIPHEAFRLFSGSANLTENMQTARTPHHLYCRTCGEPSFGIKHSADGTSTVTVNIACLERGDPMDVVDTIHLDIQIG